MNIFRKLQQRYLHLKPVNLENLESEIDNEWERNIFATRLGVQDQTNIYKRKAAYISQLDVLILAEFGTTAKLP